MNLTKKIKKPNFTIVSKIIFENNSDGSTIPFPVYVMPNGEIRKQVVIGSEIAWVTREEYQDFVNINQEARRLEAEKVLQKQAEIDKLAGKETKTKLSISK